MGCGVSWERTEHPREDSHTSRSCLNIACRLLQQNSKDWKVNADMQGRAACLPQAGPVSGDLWSGPCPAISKLCNLKQTPALV